MNNYVIAGGIDCDGFNSGHCYVFDTEAEAVIFAHTCNEESDGLLYGAVNKATAQEYCNDYNKKLPLPDNQPINQSIQLSDMKTNKYITPYLLADGDLLICLTERGRSFLLTAGINPQHDEVSIWIELTEGSDLELVMAQHLGIMDEGDVILGAGVVWNEEEITNNEAARFWSYPAPDAITAILNEGFLKMNTSTDLSVLMAARLGSVIVDAITAVATALPCMNRLDFVDLFGEQKGSALSMYYAESGLIDLWNNLLPHERQLFANRILKSFHAK